MGRFAVFDIETTGFSPVHHHRILEVAVVLVDDHGNHVYEWETLVNPQRDVGPVEIHGLSGADLYSAPMFDQIAGELASILRGRVPVAHNLSFDASFLAAEYGRLGYTVPLGPTSGLCTMRLASLYLPSGPRTLRACCDCAGYSIGTAHAALHDARAAAQLLSHYIQQSSEFISSWAEEISRAQGGDWPAISAETTVRSTRKTVAEASSGHFLGRLASRTPRSETHPEANNYLALLDSVLLDRQLSRHEQDELVAAAQMMGLSREEAMNLHYLYLTALGRLALEDGVVTSEERADLESVATLLGLPADAVDTSLDPDIQLPVEIPEVGAFSLKAGDAVVFTGDAPGLDREELEYQARSLGLRVTGAVSGKTTLVVAADPDSISGKARKARELGTHIVDYDTYIRMLGSIS